MQYGVVLVSESRGVAAVMQTMAAANEDVPYGTRASRLSYGSSIDYALSVEESALKSLKSSRSMQTTGAIKCEALHDDLLGPRWSMVGFRDYMNSSGVYRLVVALLVLGNMFIIGVEVDYGCMFGSECVGQTWTQSDAFFVIAFLVEQVLRYSVQGHDVYFHGRTFDTPILMRNKWKIINLFNVFDMCLVLARLFDLLLAVAGTPTALKIVTTLRFVNVSGDIKLTSSSGVFRELDLILRTFSDTVKAILGVLFTLTILIFLFAILMTSVLGQPDESSEYIPFPNTMWTISDYFGSVPRSAYTLLQIMTLDNWSVDIVYPIVSKYPAILILFILFLCLAKVGLLNMITGIVVENTLANAQRGEERARQDAERTNLKVFASLQTIFEEMVPSGVVEKSDVTRFVENRRVRERLRVLDIPMKDLYTLFNLLDESNKGSVSMDKFFRWATRLRGPAAAFDMHNMSVDVSRNISMCDLLTENSLRNNDLLAAVLDKCDVLDREIIQGENDDNDPVLKARKGKGKERSGRLRRVLESRVIVPPTKVLEESLVSLPSPNAPSLLTRALSSDGTVISHPALMQTSKLEQESGVLALTSCFVGNPQKKRARGAWN